MPCSGIPATTRICLNRPLRNYAQLDELAEDDPWVQLLQTVEGVGPRVAEAVVLHLDDPHRFKSADQVAGYTEPQTRASEGAAAAARRGIGTREFCTDFKPTHCPPAASPE